MRGRNVFIPFRRWGGHLPRPLSQARGQQIAATIFPGAAGIGFRRRRQLARQAIENLSHLGCQFIGGTELEVNTPLAADFTVNGNATG